MNRRDFLNNAGAALGVGVVAQTIEGCSKNSVAPPLPAAGITIDLSNSSFSALNTVGGFVLTKEIYVICTAASTYVALSSICTHQGCTVSYSSTNKRFSCPCHGGMFDSSGKVLVGPPTSPLPQYTVTSNGNILTIT